MIEAKECCTEASTVIDEEADVRRLDVLMSPSACMELFQGFSNQGDDRTGIRDELTVCAGQLTRSHEPLSHTTNEITALDNLKGVEE